MIESQSWTRVNGRKCCGYLVQFNVVCGVGVGEWKPQMYGLLFIMV